jgi:hypothetical protein
MSQDFAGDSSNASRQSLKDADDSSNACVTRIMTGAVIDGR